MTATSGTRAATAAGRSAAPLPGLWRTSLSRGRVELKAFFRERQAVVFIFAMPAVTLVLLGAIFGGQHTGPGVSIGDLYVAGLIGGGVMATSYQNLGMSIAFERERREGEQPRADGPHAEEGKPCPGPAARGS